MKNTLGSGGPPQLFLSQHHRNCGCPIHDAASSRHGWGCTTAHTTSAAAILTRPWSGLQPRSTKVKDFGETESACDPLALLMSAGSAGIPSLNAKCWPRPSPNSPLCASSSWAAAMHSSALWSGVFRTDNTKQRLTRPTGSRKPGAGAICW